MASPSARIRITLSTGGGQDVQVTGSMSLGRHPDCSIAVDEPSISKRHCRFELDDEHRLKVVNDSATNPVQVNGIKVAECGLRDGDVVNIGHCRVVVISTPASWGEDLAATMVAAEAPVAATPKNAVSLGPAETPPPPPPSEPDEPPAEPAARPQQALDEAGSTSIQAPEKAAEVQAKIRQLYVEPATEEPQAATEKTEKDAPASTRPKKLIVAAVALGTVLIGVIVIFALPSDDGGGSDVVASPTQDLPPQLVRDDMNAGGGAAGANDELNAARDLLSQASSREGNAYRALEACKRAVAKASGAEDEALVNAQAEAIHAEAQAFIDRRFGELEIEYKKATNLGDTPKAQETARRMMDLVGDPSDERYIQAKGYLSRTR